MSLTIAHQYAPALGDRVGRSIPDGVVFVALGNTKETAWAVPPEAEVLLINQNSPSVGLSLSMPAPDGWPLNLRWVHLRSTGIDKYPDWIFQVPHVTVTRGGYATPIAEYVLAVMLAHSKAIPTIWAQKRADWHAHDLATLAGKTLGVIGFGEIGKAIARRALAFDMTVIGTRRSGGPSGTQGVEIVGLETLLRRSDQIVVATPLTAETRGMLDAKTLAMVKQGAHLINVGRGQVIDTEALRVALDGPLGLATLDVTDPEPPPEGHWLYTHPKARISPHISGISPQTEDTVTNFFLSNLERFRSGQPLMGLVNSQLRY